jgi:G:T/U-mismatch repair DNA glycosylase
MNTLNLIEIIHPKMDILFVALNPPINSNNNGHYFSFNMSFWNLLYNSGLVEKPVKGKLTGDDEVFRSNMKNYKKFVYGITDLVHDKVETNSNKVRVEQERINRILDLLQNNEVRVLCLMHSKVSNAFQDAGLIKRNPDYGLVGKYQNTLIYEVPFHNASIADKEKYYTLLMRKLDLKSFEN